MGGLHQAGLLAQRAVLLEADHHARLRTEDVHALGGGRGGAGGGRVVRVVVDLVPGGDGVVPRALVPEQERGVRLEAEAPVQVGEVAQLEGLHGGAAVGTVQAVRGQGLDDALLLGQADAVEVGGVLDLGDDPDLTAGLLGQALAQLQDLLERGDLEHAVVRGGARTGLGQALLRAEGLELGEGEVLGEPAGLLDAVHDLGGPAVRELGTLRHVGGAVDQVLVAVDQHAVLGGDQVRLDHVGTLRHGQLVGGEGVLRAVPGGAAVGDDDGALRLLDRAGGGLSPGAR